MKSTEFDKIVKQRITKIQSTLVSKAKEYASDDDTLHNFNRGADMSGQTREKVLNGFMLKHQVSLLDMLDKIDNDELPTEAFVDEKIGDIINYMILLEASIKDKIRNQ